jgi:hypothetical protein
VRLLRPFEGGQGLAWLIRLMIVIAVLWYYTAH